MIDTATPMTTIPRLRRAALAQDEEIGRVSPFRSALGIKRFDCEKHTNKVVNAAADSIQNRDIKDMMFRYAQAQEDRNVNINALEKVDGANMKTAIHTLKNPGCCFPLAPLTAGTIATISRIGRSIHIGNAVLLTKVCNVLDKHLASEIGEAATTKIKALPFDDHVTKNLSEIALSAGNPGVAKALAEQYIARAKNSRILDHLPTYSGDVDCPSYSRNIIDIAEKNGIDAGSFRSEYKQSLQAAINRELTLDAVQNPANFWKGPYRNVFYDRHEALQRLHKDEDDMPQLHILQGQYRETLLADRGHWEAELQKPDGYRTAYVQTKLDDIAERTARLDAQTQEP